jgi:molybdopterin-containing oxidoreductase family iron-sulfur binding subunit
MSDGLNRRDFLKVVGVAGVATSAAACGVEQNVKLVPYVVPPEEIVPGVPVVYASTCRECPVGCGIHVKTREGRPIKIEGSPLHPLNRGTLCPRGQASLQGLYNPDRLKGPLQRTGSRFDPIAWDAALARVSDKVGALRSSGRGQSVWLLTGALTGSLDALCGEWLAAAGSTNRVIHEPFGHEALREGSRLAFGRNEVPRFELGRARFIVSFGAEFLDAWLSPLEHSRGFADAHAYANGKMARFVAVEPRLSLAAGNADEWVAPVPGTEMLVALAMAQAIVASGQGRNPAAGIDLAAYAPERVAETTGVPAETITRLAHEFAATRPSLAIPAGAALQHRNAAAFVAAVGLLNHVAGNVGETVVFGAPGSAPADPAAPRTGAKGMADLVAAMNAGQVEALVILDTNPVYSLPRAFGFRQALEKVPFKVAIAQFMDETAERCDLVLADHAPLESWGDWEPRPGVASLQQPTIQPLYDTRQSMDILLQTAGRIAGGASPIKGANALEYLQGRWQARHGQSGAAEPFEAWWRSMLAAGVLVKETAATGAMAGDLSSVKFETPPIEGEGLTLVAYPGLTYDGRGANRPWLQELPDPISKTVWSTPVEIHPETAEKSGIEMGHVVEIATAAGKIEAIAFLTPGIRKDTIAVPFGQGHTALGEWANGIGANAFDVLPAAFDPASGAAAYLSTRARVSSKGPAPFDLRTQITDDQNGRGIAQSIGLAELAHGGAHDAHAEHVPPPGTTLPPERWPEKDSREDSPYRWGMAIDLSRCTGCSACVTACYAENNIAVIGASEPTTIGGLRNIEQGRIMTWIRIERYYEDDPKGPVRVENVPMLCQHCGAAPCEPVCPVFAAYHDNEGLNGQVYNRCVGTRYCSNNCPYKVRRFNWFNYVWKEPLHLQLNPDVTVRCKGVMEKCTFCVQRIQAARDHAKGEGRQIRDGEVTPACAQACPTQAITFGNLKDRESRVSKLHEDPRHYRVLEQLNTRPAIAYLKRVRAEGES